MSKKIVITYYSRDLGLQRDRKFRKLRLKYGYWAIAVYEILLDLIYGDKGYYIIYNENTKDDVIYDILIDLNGKYCPSAETVEEIISGLVDGGLFSACHFKLGYLTSHRLQEFFYRYTVDRKDVKVDTEIWLLTTDEMKAISSRSSILSFFENQSNLSENQSNLPLKERKEKKSKEKENKQTDQQKETTLGSDVGLTVGLRESVLERIEYSVLIDRVKYPSDKSVIDNIVDIMLEVLEGTKSYYMINKDNIPASAVKARFNKLRFEHIEYVFNAFKEAESEVKNIRNYIISLLYNSYSCCDLKDLQDTMRY